MIRRQLTAGEAIKFLEGYPKNTPLFCSTSTLNEDEDENLEYIDDNNKRPCVTIEATTKYATFGYIE